MCLRFTELSRYCLQFVFTTSQHRQLMSELSTLTQQSRTLRLSFHGSNVENHNSYIQSCSFILVTQLRSYIVAQLHSCVVTSLLSCVVAQLLSYVTRTLQKLQMQSWVISRCSSNSALLCSIVYSIVFLIFPYHNNYFSAGFGCGLWVFSTTCYLYIIYYNICWTVYNCQIT